MWRCSRLLRSGGEAGPGRDGFRAWTRSAAGGAAAPACARQQALAQQPGWAHAEGLTRRACWSLTTTSDVKLNTDGVDLSDPE